MAKMNNTLRLDQPKLFNSPLETGVRALIILEAAYPQAFDLRHLTWFDHLIVHTGDVNGPESLHPAVPYRHGELLVRRRLVEEGINLMMRFHLIEVMSGPTGIEYQSGEQAKPFVNLINSVYGSALKDRAQWLAKNIMSLATEEISKVIKEKIGRWNVEFQSENNMIWKIE